MDEAGDVCSPARLQNCWVLSEPLLGVDSLLSAPKVVGHLEERRIEEKVPLLDSRWLPSAEMNGFDVFVAFSYSHFC